MASAKRKHDSDNDHLSVDASSDTEEATEHSRRHDSDGESAAKRRREEDYGKDSLISPSSWFSNLETELRLLWIKDVFYI